VAEAEAYTAFKGTVSPLTIPMQRLMSLEVSFLSLHISFAYRLHLYLYLPYPVTPHPTARVCPSASTACSTYRKRTWSHGLCRHEPQTDINVTAISRFEQRISSAYLINFTGVCTETFLRGSGLLTFSVLCSVHPYRTAHGPGDYEAQYLVDNFHFPSVQSRIFVLSIEENLHCAQAGRRMRH